MKHLDPKSCKELKDSGLGNNNGEYNLYLQHPNCTKTARVYCANMDTSNPLEYVTLPAGRGQNFGMNYRIGGNSPSAHSKTAYDKVSDILYARKNAQPVPG